MAKIEDLQARSVDKVFDSKEKADKYVVEHKDRILSILVGLIGV